jgi:hypothetical protein
VQDVEMAGKICARMRYILSVPVQLGKVAAEYEGDDVPGPCW